MKQSNKKVKVKTNNSKSFINSKGQLSGKNPIKKMDYSKAAIGGIYFPPEFYPTSETIVQYNMTAIEIENFPYLAAYWFLDFEESKITSKGKIVTAYFMATPDSDSNRNRLVDSDFIRRIKRDLLKRLDFLTSLDKISSN